MLADVPFAVMLLNQAGGLSRTIPLTQAAKSGEQFVVSLHLDEGQTPFGGASSSGRLLKVLPADCMEEVRSDPRLETQRCSVSLLCDIYIEPRRTFSDVYYTATFGGLP